ncbi:MAG: Dabb family protein [Gammaproteobacteria bacterium]
MKLLSIKPVLFLMAALSLASAGHAEEPAKASGGKAYHVTIIWLKQHGDAEARRKYIDGTKRLSKLPGVLSYNIGTVTVINREKPHQAVDDSYDIAISSTFESKQALENYLKNPEHHKVVHEVLKPLVEKYKVYDFVE